MPDLDSRRKCFSGKIIERFSLLSPTATAATALRAVIYGGSSKFAFLP